MPVNGNFYDVMLLMERFVFPFYNFRNQNYLPIEEG
jgi:hypothetical protein